MADYGKIENGTVVKIRQVDDGDTVLIPKLLAHGWLPIETTDPVYDPEYQTTSGPNYEIQETQIAATYTVSNKSLADVRTARKASMQAAYDAALAAGYTLPTLGFNVKIAPANQLDWNSGLNLLNETQAETMVVRDFGESHTITAAEYKQMVVEIGAYVHSLMQNWWRVEDAIDEAESVEAVMAVTW